MIALCFILYLHLAKGMNFEELTRLRVRCMICILKAKNALSKININYFCLVAHGIRKVSFVNFYLDLVMKPTFFSALIFRLWRGMF